MTVIYISAMGVETGGNGNAESHSHLCYTQNDADVIC